MLQRRGRVTYRALKLQFNLDDDHLEALKDELLYAHARVVADDGGLTRFVGRQTEVDILRQALARAGAGQGQVVAIVGEPGVGKSRLVHEVIHASHTRGWRVLESASVSYGRATPYFPVIDLLQRYLGIEDHDDPPGHSGEGDGARADARRSPARHDSSVPGAPGRVTRGEPLEALEAVSPDRVTEQVERLAHHALRGEVWAKAVAYCRPAGAKAITPAAYRAAVTFFAQALDALQHLPARPDTQGQAIDLRLDLCGALVPLGELECTFVYSQDAAALAEALGDQHRLGWISVYLLGHFRDACDPDHALAAGQRALAIAAGLGDVGLTVAAQNHLG
jgi:AAA ATPase domain